MKLHLLSPQEREKLLVLSVLWTTFSGAFLLVVSVNF